MKAKEWGIPVVNVLWLSDLILGHMDALKMPIADKYKTISKGDEFQMDMTKVQHLMGRSQVLVPYLLTIDHHGPLSLFITTLVGPPFILLLYLSTIL